MIPIASFFIAVIILLITYINCSKKAFNHFSILWRPQQWNKIQYTIPVCFSA